MFAHKNNNLNKIFLPEMFLSDSTKWKGSNGHQVIF